MKLNAIRFLLAALAASMCGVAPAQSYPVKPIRFIAPFPPGGSTDFLARIVALKMSESMGQQVVVENRGGAAGTIGVELAAHAAPDGYTIVMGHVGTFGVNPTLYPKLPYRSDQGLRADHAARDGAERHGRTSLTAGAYGP